MSYFTLPRLGSERVKEGGGCIDVWSKEVTLRIDKAWIIQNLSMTCVTMNHERPG